MTVSIEIIPFADSLDMYGDPDRSTAYSISGHVRISLSFTSSLFSRRRFLRLLLESLVITFEGQSELVTEETGYAGLRLCSISQELAPSEPVELSTEVHDDERSSCIWNVVFNLSGIPGWLPASSLFGSLGDCEAGTRYGLYATARFTDADDSASKSWLSAFCTPFHSQHRVVKAPRVPIQLNRFVSPSPIASTSTSLFPMANYAVQAEIDTSTQDDSAASRIPADVLSKIRVVISAPELVATEESSLPFSLRFRTTDLPDNECRRLRISDFLVDIQQTERYRTSPLQAYTSRYPVPSSKEQPPHKPLLCPHPVKAIYELGIGAMPPPIHVMSRSLSLLPENTSGRYAIAGDGYIFAQDNNPANAGTWFSTSSAVPFAQIAPGHRQDHAECDWKCNPVLRESAQSPLMGVHHQLCVTLMTTYDLTDGENPQRASQRLSFQIPIRFVRIPPSPPVVLSPTVSPTPSLSASSSCSEFSLQSMPYAQNLPAYSQLFHSNGDRKIDYSIPLPVYTPKALPEHDVHPVYKEFDNVVDPLLHNATGLV